MLRPASPEQGATWATYLARFHTDHAGITELVLRRCRASGIDPYQWCAEGLHDAPGPVLDVAAGSGPLADHLPRWIGLDAARAELDLALGHGRGPVLAARADALPVADGSLHRAVSSMAWQVLDPLDGAVAEAARALAGGGQLAVLLPATSPVGRRSAAAYVAAQVALGARLDYPNDARLRPSALAQLGAEHGLVVATDESQAFSLHLHDGAAADLVRSFYLPGVPDRRWPRAARLLRGLAGGHIDVPLRRVVLERTTARPDRGRPGALRQDDAPPTWSEP